MPVVHLIGIKTSRVRDGTDITRLVFRLHFLSYIVTIKAITHYAEEEKKSRNVGRTPHDYYLSKFVKREYVPTIWTHSHLMDIRIIDSFYSITLAQTGDFSGSFDIFPLKFKFEMPNGKRANTFKKHE